MKQIDEMSVGPADVAWIRQRQAAMNAAAAAEIDAGTASQAATAEAAAASQVS
jgi:hypothetical protein